MAQKRKARPTFKELQFAIKFSWLRRDDLWRYLMVDALDEKVAGFYRKYGFVALPEAPLRLYMRATKVAAAVTGLTGAAGIECQSSLRTA